MLFRANWGELTQALFWKMRWLPGQKWPGRLPNTSDDFLSAPDHGCLQRPVKPGYKTLQETPLVRAQRAAYFKVFLRRATQVGLRKGQPDHPVQVPGALSRGVVFTDTSHTVGTQKPLPLQVRTPWSCPRWSAGSELLSSN